MMVMSATIRMMIDCFRGRIMLNAMAMSLRKGRLFVKRSPRGQQNRANWGCPVTQEVTEKSI
jgi:hypothetical protein